MIDTIRITGEKFIYLSHQTGYKYNSTHVSDELIRMKGFLQTEYFRIFHDSLNNTYTVELSVAKLIFDNNSCNYSVCEYFALKDLVTFVARLFFLGQVYISRIDIGAVMMVENIELELDIYRNAKLHNARVNKFQHQKYKSSVFYFSRNYSVKIYDKYEESKNENDKNLLRYEISYRTQELKKVMQISPKDYKPFKGIRIESINFCLLINNFFERFENWSGAKITSVESNSALVKTLRNIFEIDKDIYNKLIDRKAFSKRTMSRVSKVSVINSERKELKPSNLEESKVYSLISLKSKVMFAKIKN